MSKLLMAGALAVLAVLLYAMTKVVNPMPDPPPPAPASKEVEAKKQAEMDKMIKVEKDKQAAQHAEELKHQPDNGAPANAEQVSKPLPANAKIKRPPHYGDMQLSDDWYRTRKPGAEGLQQLEKDDAKQKKEWDEYIKTHPGGPPSMAPSPSIAK